MKLARLPTPPASAVNVMPTPPMSASEARSLSAASASTKLRGAIRNTLSVVERMLPTRRSSPSVASTATISRHGLASVPMKPLLSRSTKLPPARRLPTPSRLTTRVSTSGSVLSMALMRRWSPASARPKVQVASTTVAGPVAKAAVG